MIDVCGEVWLELDRIHAASGSDAIGCGRGEIWTIDPIFSLLWITILTQQIDSLMKKQFDVVRRRTGN
jgi:hypothetical protein